MELASFDTVRKTSIVNSAGIKYSAFKASLKPRYWLVWTHILLAYVVMIGLLIGAGIIQKTFPGFFWLNIPIAALLTGYCLNFIHLFIHEAAHYNIAPDRITNDRLANIFIGFIIGMDIKYYRIIHFDHHRYLGTTKDTEKTYFDALTWKFIIESLTGIRAFRVMTNRDEKIKNNKGLSPEVLKNNKRMFLAGGLFNFLVLVTLCFTGFWQVAAVWLLAQLVIFPFFASLRQLLEHRREDAQADMDYNTIDQGAYSRMFGNGLISLTLGGAGFNRHLLHHWDPQISYTRLKDVEHFLEDTDLKHEMIEVRTNYLKTFTKLFNK